LFSCQKLAFLQPPPLPSLNHRKQKWGKKFLKIDPHQNQLPSMINKNEFENLHFSTTLQKHECKCVPAIEGPRATTQAPVSVAKSIIYKII
jgi:hypothetical protein